MTARHIVVEIRNISWLTFLKHAPVTASRDETLTLTHTRTQIHSYVIRILRSTHIQARYVYTRAYNNNVLFRLIIYETSTIIWEKIWNENRYKILKDVSRKKNLSVWMYIIKVDINILHILNYLCTWIYLIVSFIRPLIFPFDFDFLSDRYHLYFKGTFVIAFKSKRLNTVGNHRNLNHIYFVAINTYFYLCEACVHFVFNIKLNFTVLNQTVFAFIEILIWV